jgi:hypothetical protein
MTDPVVQEFDQAKLDTMLQAVGEGITAFGSVEIGLDYVFAELMRPANRQKASAILKAARHIETKMRVIKAVAEKHDWQDDQKAKFNNLMNRLKNRADMRNKVAHWGVVYLGEGPFYRDFPIQLLPSSYLHESSDEYEGLTLDQVREFTAKCRSLTGDLFRFVTDELGPKAGPKKPKDVGKGRVSKKTR